MSSTYAVFPPSVVGNRDSDRMHQRQSISHYDSQHHISPATPIGSNHLSPTSTNHAQSTAASPTLNTHTPAESESTLSVHYQSSDFSAEADDPFFGVDFAADGGSPSFLTNGPFTNTLREDQYTGDPSYLTPDQPYNAHENGMYNPISPDQTPSLQTSPHNPGRRHVRHGSTGHLPQSVSPQDLSLPFQPLPLSHDFTQPEPQLTPVTTGSGRSSDDGLAVAPTAMPIQSPRVTVSMWSKDTKNGTYAAPQITTVSNTMDSNGRGTSEAAGFAAAARDSEGRWLPNAGTGQQGLDPTNRPSAELGSSMNDLAAQRVIDERNQEVNEWLSDTPHPSSPNEETRPRSRPSSEQDDNISPREIAPGDQTENKPVSGQTYFAGAGGEATNVDAELSQRGPWADAPVVFPIQSGDSRFQPETSQDAIIKFERMCRDNASMLSRAATWGTRRHSLPSILDSDVEGVTSGNFLKKLSLSRGDNRRPSILNGMRDLLKTKNSSYKRSRPGATIPEDELNEPQNLAPPARTLSGGFSPSKRNVPSINTALVSLGQGAASIGTTHVRSGSITATTPLTSPRSPNNNLLGVKAIIRRSRSGSELAAKSELAGMWKKAGGPPVARLANTSLAADVDDDDDDEEDVYEDADMKNEANRMIDEISPNIAGFREHVLKLNPTLTQTNTYLVDRIAHHQVVRYKTLLNTRVKHLNLIATRSCQCGPMCIAQGGVAKVLDSKIDGRGLDPLSARLDGSDEDVVPMEGVLTSESFPQGIPIPPTTTLPAEFECQLCFAAKRFQKPSDWTKHVHEDVQPFTCTWDRCREPKMFKRKADWVRHENEGHRHLEWWTCDVEECRHVCYRRDNFLQHLVREHKFPEPKVKTKAAVKRAGATDQTWKKVETCHQETQIKPQQEPCRFCGKAFPTWKKLTVHLAKHMEQISLPVLRLVAKKELDVDTIISPVQDPPPRAAFQSFPIKQEASPPGVFDPSPSTSNAPMIMGQPAHTMPYQQPAQQQSAYVYDPLVPPQLPTISAQQFGGFTYTSNQFDGLSQTASQPHLGMSMPNHGQHAGYANGVGGHGNGYADMAPGAASYMSGVPTNPYMTSSATDVEPFPSLSLDALGLQQAAAGTYGNGGLMDPANGATGMEHHHYTQQQHHQGSTSPYSRSPSHSNAGQGYYGS